MRRQVTLRLIRWSQDPEDNVPINTSRSDRVRGEPNAIITPWYILIRQTPSVAIRAIYGRGQAWRAVILVLVGVAGLEGRGF